MRLRLLLVVALAALPAAGASASPRSATSGGDEAEGPRTLAIDDYFRIGEVGDPRVSPDGRWIAYTVTTHDLEEDESRTRIWMLPAGGGEPVALTTADASSSHPRWSSDGRYLAFLSARKEGKKQVWTLFRQGGEAMQLSDTAQDVGAFEWSPDGRRMVLVLQDAKPEELEAKEKGEDYEEKTAPPWVVSRRQFKLDYVGYLDTRRTHLYVLDVATLELTQLTDGDFDDSSPAWSPDGSRIAFVSNRTEDPDANYNTDIWLVPSEPSAPPSPPLRITSNPGPDTAPAWSPDGKLIAHVSATDVSAMLYATNHLAVSAAGGGGLRLLTAELDRNVQAPRFSPDGRFLYFLLEDAGEQQLARVTPGGGELDRLIEGPAVVSGFDPGPAGEVAALVSQPRLPPEIFLYRQGRLEQRSFTNQELLAQLRLGDTVKVSFDSRDGTPVEGFVIQPPGFVDGRRYPAILDIHGGPQDQYDWSFHFEGQLYAAHGYLVLHPNPRGSTGYGQAFCLGIWRAWGGPDYEDVMAAVDYATGRGWADPERLGVTGWSYGGMLTNHVITKTDRFSAAATGASATLYVVNYGHDQYQRWWEQELGLPWEPESRALWEQLSPFNRLEQVTTPTLILGGEKDWNVPIINSEQLYLALKRLGKEAELVVYPGEYHGIDTPSHLQDLYRRHLDWFGKYLEGETAAREGR